VLLAGLAEAAAAQTAVLTGRIVSLTRAPVSDIRVRVVRFGEPTVFQSGEFRIELPAGTEEVEIQSLSPAWELVYPFGGRIAVPRGDQGVVIVVGKPVEQTITDALAERSRLLERVLRENGVQGAAIGRVEDGIQRILTKLDLKAADLRDEVQRREAQAERYPAIARAVNAWVLEANDLLHALRLLQPMMDKQLGVAIRSLSQAVLEYNETWEQVSTGRNGFESDVETYWPEGPLRRRDLAGLMDNEIERTHRQQILPLNAALAVIRSAVGSGGDRGKLKDGLAELTRLLPAAEAGVQSAERRASVLLETLRPASAG
jgi:hypothetical protein